MANKPDTKSNETATPVTGGATAAAAPAPASVTATPTPAAPLADGRVQLQLNEANLETTYANVANVWGNREEIMLDFGMSSIRRGAGANISLQMSKRIVMNAFTAKRLALMLQQAIQTYEAKFGRVELATQETPDIAHTSDEAAKFEKK